MFTKKPRKVSEIISSITDITDELALRIGADVTESERIEAEIQALKEQAQEVDNSRVNAVTIRNNILRLITN